jgi:imidazolonepropionase
MTVNTAFLIGSLNEPGVGRQRPRRWAACHDRDYVYTLSVDKKSGGAHFMAAAQAERDRVRAWRNARLATLAEERPGLGIVERGAIVARNGRILYAGPEEAAPSALLANADIEDCEGRWITPGLVDCHTHLIHAGDRAREFELRLAGASYEEIAHAGGGIVSSVKALRAASEDELVRQTLPRLDALIAEGVTTIEIKSGYGLDLANESKSLRAARRLGRERAIGVSATFLGAHALPPEMGGDKTRYIDLVAHEMIPAIARDRLADAVDGFCETIAFSVAEIARVFSVARAHGLPVKLHADQLSNSHGAALAARFGALSADHLEYADEEGVAAMAKEGCVAVMLPGAFYFIRETQRPPIEAFRRHGVRMAVATDCNPGTSPLTSPLLAMNLAATCFRMTIEECIAGVTREAARALGLLAETGTLEAGKWADLAIWNIERPAELVYRLGFNPLHRRLWRSR